MEKSSLEIKSICNNFSIKNLTKLNIENSFQVKIDINLAYKNLPKEKLEKKASLNLSKITEIDNSGLSVIMAFRDLAKSYRQENLYLFVNDYLEKQIYNSGINRYFEVINLKE